MKLVLHAFATERLEWRADPVSMDERDEPDWAVWETTCFKYRITYSAKSNKYTVSRLRVKIINRTTHREWVPFGFTRSHETAIVACEQHRKEERHARA